MAGCNKSERLYLRSYFIVFGNFFAIVALDFMHFALTVSVFFSFLLHDYKGKLNRQGDCLTVYNPNRIIIPKMLMYWCFLRKSIPKSFKQTFGTDMMHRGMMIQLEHLRGRGLRDINNCVLARISVEGPFLLATVGMRSPWVKGKQQAYKGSCAASMAQHAGMWHLPMSTQSNSGKQRMCSSLCYHRRAAEINWW